VVHRAKQSTPISIALADTQLILQDHSYGASASRGVPVYYSDLAGTRCTYPIGDDLLTHRGSHNLENTGSSAE